MEIKKLDIDGLFLIEPKIFSDDRGYFYESFNLKEFNEKTGLDFNPVQDNESKSSFGVIRGLHFQKEPYQQAKLVRVVKGEILDVAIDVRPESDTFGQYMAVVLSETNKRQFFIPKGFAHGFVVLSDEVIFQYKCDDYYNKESEDGVSYDYIPWEILTNGRVKRENFVLSDKDNNREKIHTLEELKEKFKDNGTNN